MYLILSEAPALDFLVGTTRLVALAATVGFKHTIFGS